MSKKSLSSSQLMDFKKANKSLRKELDKSMERITELKIERAGNESEIKKLKKEIKELKQRVEIYKSEVDMLYKVIEDLNNDN